MTHGLKALLLAASTIITCIIVGLGFQMAGEAKRIGTYVIGDMQQYRTAMEERDIMKYDGVAVYGGDVVNFMKKELPGTENGFSVLVIGENTEQCYRTRTEAGPTTEWGSEQYIAPTDEYVGAVVRNENDVITQVRFMKKQ